MIHSSGAPLKAAIRIIRRSGWTPAIVVAALVAAISEARASAAEPFRPFLEGLRARGYYTEAIDYLEVMRTSELISAELKETIPYEKGLTFVEAASQEGDFSVRETFYGRANDSFREFLNANPKHALAGGAGNQLASVLVERARTLIARSQRPSAENKPLLVEQARELLTEAQRTFEAAIKNFEGQLAKFDKLIDPKRTDLVESRNQLRTDLVQAKLMAAMAAYETSRTAAAESAEREELLRAAAKKYADLYKDQGSRLGGLIARFYEGRCHQELGETTLALSIYDELIEVLPNDPDFRPLKAKAVRQALECWIRDKKYADAVEKALPFVSQPRGKENLDPEWLAMKYLMAQAMEQQALKLPKQDPKTKELLGEAREMAVDVARVKGSYQKSAQALVVKLGGSVGGGAVGQPKTFDEAFDQGQQALQAKEQASAALRNASANSPERPKLEDEVRKRRIEAMKSMRLATQLADRETPIDSLNQARYFLGYLLYDGGRHYDAAVLGEFMARKFTKSPVGLPCAEIALKSYQVLYQKPADQAFIGPRLEGWASYVIGTWPDQKLTSDAINILISLAITRGEIDKVNQHLSKLPADSPLRAGAEVRVGQSIWGAYLKALRLPEGERPPQTQLDTMVKDAQANLERGIEGMRKTQVVDDHLGLAALSLAQIYVDTSQASKAVTLLEDEKIGPLKLIENKHDLAKRKGFLPEAYMAALRAYVSVEPQRMDDAVKVLESLEDSVGKDPQESEKLILRLMVMGQALERQIRELQKRGEKETLEKTAAGFNAFLSFILKRDTNSFNALNWVAATYASLGSGFKPDVRGELPPEAKTYFDKSIEAYRKAIPKAPNEETKLAIELRIAATYRSMSRYEDATDVLQEILKRKPNVLACQIEAATTYQEWAASMPRSNQVAYYDLSIKGGREGTIWGWAKIANITAHNPKFREIFYQSRFNLAQCHYWQALAEGTGTAERKKRADAAKADIRLTYSLYPELGGPDRTQQYNKLLMQIQELLNEKRVGLDEFKKTSAGAG